VNAQKRGEKEPNCGEEKPGVRGKKKGTAWGNRTKPEEPGKGGTNVEDENEKTPKRPVGGVNGGPKKRRKDEKRKKSDNWTEERREQKKREKEGSFEVQVEGAV